MTGALAKGALVQYLPTSPVKTVVTAFQYNPETMVHTWTQQEPTGKPGVKASNPQAVPGVPGESFQLTIFLDADDDVVSGIPALMKSAAISGVGARLAALEMLLYPVPNGQAAPGGGACRRPPRNVGGGEASRRRGPRGTVPDRAGGPVVAARPAHGAGNRVPPPKRAGRRDS